MNIETRKLSDLKPLDRNVRKHNDKQVEEMIRSLDQFGQTRAIVIDELGNILIGNCLYMAMKKTGAETAECHVMTGLTETQKKKLVLADNQVYKIGADDYNEIRNFITDITSTGDFDIAGFDTLVLEAMTISDEEKEDEINSYGVITDENLTKPHEEPEIPINNQEQPEPKKAVIVTEQEALTPATRRHIVCPNCGEVIYLD